MNCEDLLTQNGCAFAFLFVISEILPFIAKIAHYDIPANGITHAIVLGLKVFLEAKENGTTNRYTERSQESEHSHNSEKIHSETSS